MLVEHAPGRIESSTGGGREANNLHLLGITLDSYKGISEMKSSIRQKEITTRHLGGCLTVLLVLALCSCGGPLPISTYAPFSKSVLAARSYRIVEKAVSGKACDLMVLGISTGDRSYAAALKDLHKKVKSKYGDNVREYVLINQVDDWNVRFYLLLMRVCTIITADVAVLGDLAPNTIMMSSKSGKDNPSLPAFPEPIADIDLLSEEKESLIGGLTSAVSEVKDTATKESEEAEDIGKQTSDKTPKPEQDSESSTGSSEKVQVQDIEAAKDRGSHPSSVQPAKAADEAGSDSDNSDKEQKYSALLERARKYRAKGMLMMAAGMALQARQLWFNGATAQNLLGAIYLQQQNFNKAKKYYSEYLKLRPNAKDAETIRRLVLTLEKKRKKDDLPVADDL